MKKAAFYLLALMACLLAGGKAYAQATVTTDQSDYPPGSTVNITGSGFAPGETVQLQVLNVTDPTDTGPEHDPWTVTADTNGNFTATWYVTSDEANMTLQLTATGLTSGLTAQINFTDSIGAPTGVGTATSTTSSTSIAVTLTSAVAANNTMIVCVAADQSTTITVSVTDTAGNTYTKDADVNNASGKRTLVFSAPVTTALTTSDSVTVHFSSAVTTIAVSMASVSGLVSASPVDKTATGTGSTAAAATANTATTTQANELLIGAIGILPGSGTTVAAGTGFTLLAYANAPSSVAIQPEYQIVSSTGAYAATATLSPAHQWSAAIVTYKAFTNATQLAFTTQPVTTTAGSTMANVVVQIQNSFGNNIASNNVPITLTLNTGSFASSSTTTVNTGSGGSATFSNLAITNAGSYTITASASGIGAGLASATSSSFTINAAAASQLVITNTVVTVTAGVASSAISVQRQDQYGNPTTNSAVTVNLTSSSATGSFTNAAGTTAITSVTIAANASTTNYLYRDTVAGSPTITNSATGLTSDTQVVTVIPAAASKLVIKTEPSATATAGVAFTTQPAVYVEDQFGNVATNDSSTVTAALATGTGPLQGTATATPSLGVATFNNLADNLAESIKLKYTDGVLTPATNTTTIAVSTAAASKLVIKTEPSATATAGVAFTTQPAVYVEDQFGNVATNDSSTVTAALATGTGPLQGTATATPSLGVATFNNLADNLAESIKLKYTDGVLTPATNTTTIAVSTAAASKLVITSTAVTNTAGVASSNITVQRQDAFGNPNTTDAARTVTLASTSTGTVTFTPASLTIATGLSSTNFTYTDTQAGTPTITAASTSPSTITSATQVETVKPAAVDHFVISAISSPQTAGTAITGITLTAQDVYNNTATNFTTTVAYGGTAGITGTSTAFTLGVLSGVSVTPTVAGSGLTFVVTGSTKTGTNTFNVNPGAIASYTVSATAATRGSAFNVTVTAKDANANTVTTDSSTVVTMSNSTGNVQFTGNPATLTNGTFTISALDNYFETVTITATDVNSKTGNTSVTVNPLNGDYQSRANGNWNSTANPGTWQVYSGGAWVNTGTPPTSSTTGQIGILSGNTVTVTASVTAQNLYIVTGGTVAINSSQTLTVNNGNANGVIANGTSGGALSVTNGTLISSGNNTYSGGTTIGIGGTLSVTNVNTGSGNQNLGSGGITFANGGTLLENGTVGPQTFTGSVTLNTGGGVITMVGQPIYLTGNISGGGGLTTGGSDLILNRSATGSNAIGSIAVNSNRLFVFTTNSIGGSSISVASGATIDFSTGGNTTPVNTMTFASGACLANRAGTLTVSTNYITFPSSGTMIFNSDDLNTTPILINGTYPALTGNLTVQVGPTGSTTVGNVTNNAAISGSGSLTKTSTGTLVLGSANTYTGGTTVSSGFLTANVTGSLGSGALSIASGATNTLTTGTTETVAGLFLNGVRQVAGTWGSTAGGTVAVNKSNYFGSTATGVLTDTMTITVTAAANTKNYDGTTNAAGTPTITAGALVIGDTATLTENYTNKNQGTGKTLIPTAVIMDSTGTNNVTSFYTITYVNYTSGVINKTNLTVTAAANTKNYDGGTTASAVPTITAGSIQTGDTAPTWTETYASKNVGTGLTLTPAGVVTDGNSGMNYNYTYATVATGVINATNLTVTAVANTKIYNGTTTASALPTITAGSIQTGDTAPTWTETYNNKNVGSGKTLTPAGVVTDGNSGANYNYTYATVATGVISQTNMTVTAVANTKIYNGTTSAAALPTITAGSIQTGDTAPTWTETYDTRNQGTGKTLTPAGVVTDGNSGANYNYTYATVAAGVINKTNITVTAASQTKTYDGTTSSTGTPTITSGSIQTGDSAPTWTQTFDSPNASAVNGRTLTPAGVVSDGNGGANYNYTYATATGTINKASATFTVTPYTVTYDGSAHTATVSTITGVNGETGATVGAVTLSTTHTLAGTYSTDFWSFTGTGNYNSIGNTTITDTINTATPTISGVTNSQSISYGTASVTLGGTVSATGPVYPANGETVSVTINGSTQNATISGGAGHFAVSFPTATIPPSPTAYTIAYAYAGDANLNAAANNTGTTLTVTGISVPALFYTNSPGIGLRILLSDITNNVGTKSSLSSPAYAITGVSASSTNGGTVFNNATTILYTPATNNIASDTFTYTLSDGSASATATVTVTFISPAGPTLTPSLDGSNHPVIKFYGILGQSYHIQVSTNLPTWTDVVAVTIPSTGDGSYTWTNTSVTVPPFTGYFRVRYP